MMHKTNTGGLLNELNGKMRISAPQNSVPIIKLINTHQPRTAYELEKLIEYHHTHDCPCGIKSKGTVYDFGKNLYESQKYYFKDYLFTLEECMQWEYDLFITNSLKGNNMEKQAMEMLENGLPDEYHVRKSHRLIDEKCNVDLEIVKDDKTLVGVQVKPVSYNYTDQEVKDINKTKNSNYKYDVIYLYYDDEGTIINAEDINEKVMEMKK